MKIIVNGACGQMGQILCRRAEKAGHAVVWAADKYRSDGGPRLLCDFEGEADVVIDFSHHSSAEDLCAFALRRRLPLVIATTGHTEEEIALIRSCSADIPVFYSYNMSLGAAVLADLAARAAKLFPDADIEIVEAHHNRKIDAPSGTAKMIFDSIRSVLPEKTAHCGRAGMGVREKDEIGISSLRMGGVVGVHEVYICTDNQMLTLRHEAHSRDLFADGALSAAAFVAGKGPGLYTMKDLASSD